MGWLSNPALWQRVWEASDIETDRKDRKGEKRPIRPGPGSDTVDRRGVFTVPDITAFTSVHVRELVRILLVDDSKRLALEGIKARSNAIGDAGLVELTTFLDNDPVTGQPLFPNFKKLVLFQDLIVGAQQTMDWWKRDCTWMRLNGSFSYRASQHSRYLWRRFDSIAPSPGSIFRVRSLSLSVPYISDRQHPRR
jgi:hypothetical protein